ncbi:hypothetical protein ACWCW7_34580 [Nocardia tengchongensis]
MSAEDVLALLNEDRPAGWLQYQDGSWAPVGQDGWVGPPIKAADLIEVARRDFAALEAAGFVTEIIDIEPLEVVDVEYESGGGQAIRLALDSGPANRTARNLSE